MFGIDDAIIGAGIGAAGNIVSGIFGSSGQKSTNKANLRIAREQMRFQERMAGTTWQRGVADMRKAGINPMLAVSQGGAPSPTGASSVSQNPNAGLSAGIASAFNAAATYIQLRQQEAQTRNIEANTKLTETKLPKAEVMSTPYEIAQSVINKVKDYVKGGKPVEYLDPGDMATNQFKKDRVGPFSRSNVHSAKSSQSILDSIGNLVSKKMGDFQEFVHKHR